MAFSDDIDRWIVNILGDPNLTEPIRALNFGFFESEKGYCLYYIGSSEYDPDDGDWACNEEYAPQNKYLQVSGPFNDLAWDSYNFV